METKRKGPRSLADINPEYIAKIEEGVWETANLMEYLAVNRNTLLKNIAGYTPIPYFEVPEKPELSILNQDRFIAKELCRRFPEAFYILRPLDSDIARSWAALMLQYDGSSFEYKIKSVTSLANDAHSGVREFAWMAVRDSVIENGEKALKTLADFSLQPEENLRRFGVEVTRPRGVWCAQFELLKKNPELGQEILIPLMSDPSKYVQNSVANWLNDASKSQPLWVKNFCRKHYIGEGPNVYITNRALRTINKDS